MQMPALRKRVGTSGPGQAETVSELPPGEVGCPSLERKSWRAAQENRSRQMKSWMVISLSIILCSQGLAVDCVKPAIGVPDPESPVSFSLVVIAALATAHSGYLESVLSPGIIVEPDFVGSPLAKVRRCVDSYVVPFQGARNEPIRLAAGEASLAVSILEDNEKRLTEQVTQMVRGGASTQKVVEHVIEYRDSGMGRWGMFENLALSTALLISRIQEPMSGKSDLVLTLDPDERLLLRLEILKTFRISRLNQPAALTSSPEKGAALLFQLLSAGRINFSGPEWK